MEAAATEREAAFRKYVVPEIDVMYRVAMSLTRNKADAEDLVQDSLIRAYKAVGRFDGRYPRAWLLTIMPLGAAFSVDAWRAGKRESATVPIWTIWLLRFQIGVPYFFGGIAKLNPDWLAGEPRGSNWQSGVLG